MTQRRGGGVVVPPPSLLFGYVVGEESTPRPSYTASSRRLNVGKRLRLPSDGGGPRQHR